MRLLKGGVIRVLLADFGKGIKGRFLENCGKRREREPNLFGGGLEVA